MTLILVVRVAAAEPSVPLWVPVAVAAMGFVGTLLTAIIGQVLAGRREDARWERETERDATRWQRERDERREQWTREDSVHWLPVRRDSYGRLLAALEAYHDAVQRLVVNFRVGGSQTDARVKDALAPLRVAAELAEADIELIAPEAVAGAARTALINIRYVEITLWPVAEASLSDVNEAHARATKSLLRTRRRMREDLGVTTPTESVGPQAASEQSTEDSAGSGSVRQRGEPPAVREEPRPPDSQLPLGTYWEQPTGQLRPRPCTAGQPAGNKTAAHLHVQQMSG